MLFFFYAFKREEKNSTWRGTRQGHSSYSSIPASYVYVGCAGKKGSNPPPPSPPLATTPPPRHRCRDCPTINCLLDYCDSTSIFFFFKCPPVLLLSFKISLESLEDRGKVASWFPVPNNETRKSFGGWHLALGITRGIMAVDNQAPGSFCLLCCVARLCHEMCADQVFFNTISALSGEMGVVGICWNGRLKYL